jgi:hypothetical protein
MNRLYTLEGYTKNKTVGNPLFARFMKLPRFNPMAFKLPSIPRFNPMAFKLPSIPRFSPPPVPMIPRPVVKIAPIKIAPLKIAPLKIAPPKINIPKPPVFKAPRIQAPKIPRIQAPKFPSFKAPKNPFSKSQKPDMSSSYEDFFNELESQKENDFQPETNYPETTNEFQETPEMRNEFTQSDIEMETNEIPVYGYDYNDVMLGAKKNIFGKSLSFQKKLFNPGGLKFSMGRKKPSLLQKLTLKKGSKKIAKITPKEMKRGLAVTGAVAATIATAGTSAPLIAGAATLTGISAGAIVSGAGTVATASVLGSTLMANGGTDIGSLLNTAGALLNNQSIQNNVPLANSANQAINTGLSYYNTGAGIAEGLGLSTPSLGTTSQDFFSLFGKQENKVLDRSLQIDKTKQGQPSPLNPFKNPLTDPTSPLYTPPVGTKPTGQKGQTQILTTDKNKIQSQEPTSNIGLIIGIGVLGYLFINRKKK